MKERRIERERGKMGREVKEARGRGRWMGWEESVHDFMVGCEVDGGEEMFAMHRLVLLGYYYIYLIH